MAVKIYYRIGEIAKMFDVNPSLIRYWEKEFHFIKPRKSSKGTRYYSQKDIDRFAIVYHLIKEKGMTIQGAKEYFGKYHYEKPGGKLNVINTLTRTKQLLKEIRNVLFEALEKPQEKKQP